MEIGVSSSYTSEQGVLGSAIPSIRRRTVGTGSLNLEGRYVLYWMTGFRRTRFNFALQRAVELANELAKPLLVLEGLRSDYPWASDRHHRFIVQGMAANAAALEASPARGLSYVEGKPGDGQGLLRQLASEACAVIADDAPIFFLERMLAAAADQHTIVMELVDSNGLLPLRAASKVFSRAFDLRRFLHKNLGPHLVDVPDPDPLASLRVSWSEATNDESLKLKARHRAGLRTLEELRSPAAVIGSLDLATCGQGAVAGGSNEARRLLNEFVSDKLSRYVSDRTNLDRRATCEISPHLHYGHISAHEVLIAIAEREEWTPLKVAATGKGQRLGWWGMSEPAESFLDQLATWRELGFNMAWQNPRYTEYASLPGWAQQTLADHQNDTRETLYSLEELDEARTHDELWNAAQRELRRDGRIHYYMRMLWGKKILEWSPTPQLAAEVMIELNNRYALDGRDPNSYSGIYWCLGRYDRAWGPERPIFGKIRYMSSDNTRRKMRVGPYLERYADRPQQGLDLGV